MESLLSMLIPIASIASIVSMFISIGAAVRSSKSASNAEKLQKEVIERRKLIELTDIYNETEKIMRSVSVNKLLGINPHNLANKVEKYACLVNENKSSFPDDNIEEVDLLCDGLEKDIESLLVESDPYLIKDIGSGIYKKINKFRYLVKNLVDEKQEQPFR